MDGSPYRYTGKNKHSLYYVNVYETDVKKV